MHARRGFGRALLTSRREAEQEERKAGKGESEKGKKGKERYEYVMKKRERVRGVRFAACDGHEFLDGRQIIALRLALQSREMRGDLIDVIDLLSSLH